MRYAKSKHYIDDEYYASAFAEQKSSSRSKRMIRMDLLQRGIDRDTVDSVLSDADIDEKKTIEKLITKKYRSGSEIDAKEAAKLMRSLCSKGFAYEDIKTVIGQLHIDITYKSD